MHIYTDQNPAAAAAAALANFVQQHPHETILCLYAGGSAFEIFTYITDADTKRRTIFMAGDERASGERTLNNYSQLDELLRERRSDYRILDTSYKGTDTVVTYAKKISQLLTDHISTATRVVAILGIGTDGHTAGIFPLEEKNFTDIYTHESTYVPVHLEGLTIDSRASITPHTILTKVDMVLGYAVGENKKPVIQKLIQTAEPIHSMPAQLLKLHRNAVLYTDVAI